MCRDYHMMRSVMSTIAKRQPDELSFNDFIWTPQRDMVISELKRLCDEGLIRSTLEFDENDVCLSGRVTGFTSEGQQFWNLIENGSVWKPIHETLTSAGIDLSYPMLKDVCEEIVRRYVASFIPENIRQ